MKHPRLNYKTPITFSSKQHLILAVAPPIADVLLRLLLMTTRVTIIDRHYLDETLATHGRAILGVWHETFALALKCFRGTGYHTLTSYSFDGELAAQLAERFGLHALRGSSSRGGSEALLELKKAVELGITVGITLDGPRGPRRVAKPGAAVLSEFTGVPVVPVALAAKPAWRLKSWDRTIVPKPFCRIGIQYGAPLIPPAGGDTDAHRQAIEDSLNSLHAELEGRLGCVETTDKHV